MTPFSRGEQIVFVLNSAGFAIYLAWLVLGQQNIFYTQEGVLYLLPCLPFFFVYAFLFGSQGEDPDEEADSDEATEEKRDEEQ
jgi:hypothetical protein